MNETGSQVSIVRVSIGAVLLAIVLAFVVDLLAGPFFSFSTKTWPPEIRGGKLIGGIQGPVKAADVDAGVVNVASGFLGLASLPLVVTPDTQIAVHGKLGGMADLDRGQLVRVAYEVLPDRLLAWRVDVLDRWSQSSEMPVPAETDSDAATEEPSNEDALKSRAAPASEPPPRPEPALPSTVTSAPPVPAPVSPTPTRVPAAAPNRNGTVTTPTAKRAVVAPSSSPRTPETPRAAPAPRPAAAPTSPQAEDSGAVIDWLIKESSARSQ